MYMTEATQNQPHMSRRDFLKLCTLALGIVTGDSAIRSVNRILEPSLRNDPMIPEINDLNAPLPLDPELYFQDPLHVLPEGWQNSLKRDEPMFGISFTPTTQILQDWWEYSHKNLPYRKDIPLSILHLPAKQAIIPDTIAELGAIKNTSDPRNRFEEFLRAIAPTTHEICYPYEDIPTGVDGPRAIALLQKYDEVAHALMSLREIYNRYLNIKYLNSDHPQYQSVLNGIEKIAKLMDQMNFSFRDPLETELYARISNTHLLVDSRIWPQTPDVRPMIGKYYCYGFAARMIHMALWAGNCLKDCPLRIKGNGVYGIRDIGTDSDLTLYNLFRWMSDYSQQFGWIDMSGKSYEDVLQAGKTHFFVVIHIDSADNPGHTWLLRRLSRGEGDPEILVRAEFSSFPYGELYAPVIPENWPNASKNPNYRIFAHQF
jgi:hypothetical protein